jgi:hypothetical protein
MNQGCLFFEYCWVRGGLLMAGESNRSGQAIPRLMERKEN